MCWPESFSYNQSTKVKSIFKISRWHLSINKKIPDIIILLQKKGNIVKNFIGWTLGSIITLLGSVMMIGVAFLPGLIFTIIGLSLIPSFRVFLVQKTNIVAGNDTKKLIYLVLWVAFVGSTVYWGNEEQQKRETAQAKEQEVKQKVIQAQKEVELAKLKKEKDARTAYFNSSKESVMKEIESLKDQKEYLKAIKKTNLYIQTQDKDLIALKDSIANIQRKIEIERKTNKILSDLKTIPAKDIDKNYKLYRELAAMHPENNKYQKKTKYYKGKIEKRDIRIAAEKIFYGEIPIQSAWDGSYYEVERYLKSVANDPDSIDIENCTEPYKADKGWIVLCKYRGRNAFGGMILKHNWFIIRQNQVIGVEEPSAYSIK